MIDRMRSQRVGTMLKLNYAHLPRLSLLIGCTLYALVCRRIVRRLPILAFTSLFPFPLTAQVDEKEDEPAVWYVGGGLSYTDISAGSFGGLNNGSDRTEADSGFVLTAGYTLNRNFAVEIGYLDAGAPRFESTRGLLCVEPDLCRVKVKQDTDALAVTVVGKLPLGPVWEFYGKAGAVAWDAVADQTLTSAAGGVPVQTRVELSGSDLLIGLGIGLRIASGVRFRLGYEFFDTDDALLAVDRAAGFQQFALEAHWRF